MTKEQYKQHVDAIAAERRKLEDDPSLSQEERDQAVAASENIYGLLEEEAAELGFTDDEIEWIFGLSE